MALSMAIKMLGITPEQTQEAVRRAMELGDDVKDFQQRFERLERDVCRILEMLEKNQQNPALSFNAISTPEI